jgi:argininosuccinate synthase
MPLPEDAYPDTCTTENAPESPVEIEVAFEQGIPTALDNEPMDPVSLIEQLNEIGASHGIGRGMHVGDTILGIKGRVGFEAPAAEILIPAHRELEKVVLTRWQLFQKSQLGDFYGMLLHEGQYFDPVMRDLEAYLDSSQRRVSGSVRVRLHKSKCFVLGAESTFSLFNPEVAAYGEENRLWDARDARGFTQIYGLQALLADRVSSADENSSS